MVLYGIAVLTNENAMYTIAHTAATCGRGALCQYLSCGCPRSIVRSTVYIYSLLWVTTQISAFQSITAL